MSHSSILLNQLIPPSSLQYSWLLCTYQTNNISPISIDTDHTFWCIPIHECCTYIIYIICPIIGSCLIGCSEVGIFKLMLVEVGIKFDLMHIMCMSSWAEWEEPYWPMKCTRGDFTYILSGLYDDRAIAIVYWWYDARRRRRIFWCHRRMHYLRRSLVSQPRWC